MKRVAPCRCLDGHVKEPYEMSMALGVNLPAHLCPFTYITEISLHVTLNNDSFPLSLSQKFYA